jgi:hypothetical protein
MEPGRKVMCGVGWGGVGWGGVDVMYGPWLAAEMERTGRRQPEQMGLRGTFR